MPPFADLNQSARLYLDNCFLMRACTNIINLEQGLPMSAVLFQIGAFPSVRSHKTFALTSHHLSQA